MRKLYKRGVAWKYIVAAVIALLGLLVIMSIVGKSTGSATNMFYFFKSIF